VTLALSQSAKLFSAFSLLKNGKILINLVFKNTLNLHTTIYKYFLTFCLLCNVKSNDDNKRMLKHAGIRHVLIPASK